MLYVPDTHALVWYLTADRKLGRQAKNALMAVDTDQDQAMVSVIVLTEILDLGEKGRTSVELDGLLDHLRRHAGYVIVRYTLEVLEAARHIIDVPELHDRIIVATARLYGATVISRDPAIAATTAAQVVW